VGVFHVIVLDPPWPYWEEYGALYHRAASPYPQMQLPEIAALDLPAADDCVLWFWTTHKFMREAFPLLDGSGFTDRQIVTWVNDRMGLGASLRSQSEFCIMATKGRPSSISRTRPPS
jgi:N6-adenosine-specific RNA methylase IME4